MPTKTNKSGTRKGRAAQKPEPLTKAYEIEKAYQGEAIQFAELLANPATSPEFRRAFGVVFDLMIKDVDFQHPSLFRATYGAIRMYLDGNTPAEAEALSDALLRLAETMNPEEVQEAARRVAVSWEGGA